ncbi:MAG: hypothetical protein AAFP16_17860 [Pseudomonadota bacterium]
MASHAADQNSCTAAQSHWLAQHSDAAPAPDWAVVVLSRQAKPPLRFKGRRLSLHEASLWGSVLIKVELWQQAKKGFVISYSYLAAAQISDKAIQVSNLAEATDCLENVCANLDVSRMQVVRQDQLWLDLQLHLSFRQRFHMLVADVLADWHHIPQLQEPA